MDIVPQNKTEAQIEIESVFNQVPVQEALENPFISLGDGSSSSPNLRAVEMVMTAIFANRYKGVVLTNFYHGASFRESADKIGLWLRDMEFDFKVDRDLLELHYIPYFGDPQTRIDNMVSRMRDKGKSEEEIKARITSFESTFPVSVFSADGVSFVDYIKAVRQDTTRQVMEQLGLTAQGSFDVEVAVDSFSRITLNDVLKPKDRKFLTKYPVMKITCPECSLSNDSTLAEHGVSLSGDIFQKVDGIKSNGNLANNCKSITALKANLAGRSLFDIPISDLTNMGFKLSGKILFLLETRLGKNPKITQAIRAYSAPHGTIKAAASNYEGLTILTPSVYIKVDDVKAPNGCRDANIFELLDFMSTNEGLSTVKQFTDAIPLTIDGLVRTLNLSNGRITVRDMES